MINRCIFNLLPEPSVSGAAFGCFEFWLSRYQTLIGSCLALLAAFLTIYFLRSQNRTAAQQLAAARLASLQDKHTRLFQAGVQLDNVLQQKLAFEQNLSPILSDQRGHLWEMNARRHVLSAYGDFQTFRTLLLHNLADFVPADIKGQFVVLLQRIHDHQAPLTDAIMATAALPSDKPPSPYIEARAEVDAIWRSVVKTAREMSKHVKNTLGRLEQTIVMLEKRTGQF